MRKGQVGPLGERGYKPHPLHWAVESLWDEPSYLEKPMFGCRACYLHGRLMLVLASQGEDPWQGILIPTEKEFQASLLAEYPAVVVHPVLGKWLYLPEDSEEFEETAQQLVERISRADPRIGVLPKPRTTKRRAAKPT